MPPATYDNSLTPEEVAILVARQELLRQCFFGSAVVWSATNDPQQGRVLRAAEAQNPTICIAEFRLADLTELTDEGDFQLDVITGRYAPR
jgi:hypothetical protein